MPAALDIMSSMTQGLTSGKYASDKREKSRMATVIISD